MTPIQPFSCLRTLDRFVQQSETKPLLERICHVAAAAFAAIPALLADLAIYTANKIYSISLTPPQFDALACYSFIPEEPPVVELPESAPEIDDTQFIEPLYLNLSEIVEIPLPSAPEIDEPQFIEPLYPNLSEIDEPLQIEPSAPERVEEHSEISFAEDMLFLNQALERLPDDHEVLVRIKLLQDPLDPQMAREDFKMAAFVALQCLHHASRSRDARIPDFLNFEMSVDGETLREFLNSGPTEQSTEKLYRFAEKLGQSDAFINAFLGLRAEHALTVGI